MAETEGESGNEKSGRKFWEEEDEKEEKEDEEEEENGKKEADNDDGDDCYTHDRLLPAMSRSRSEPRRLVVAERPGEDHHGDEDLDVEVLDGDNVEVLDYDSDGDDILRHLCELLVDLNRQSCGSCGKVQQSTVEIISPVSSLSR